MFSNERAVIDVVAGQLVYTRAEHEQSPGRSEGFQTVYSTKGMLQEKEVEQIETRLFLNTAQGRERKRVFFQTTRENIILAQLVSVATLDSAGRAGNFLAHALIFSAAEFSRFGGNPFDVFRSFAFFSNLDDALGAGDVETGDIEQVRISLERTRTEVFEWANSWASDELAQLLVLSPAIAESRGGQKAIAVRGSEEAFERVLELCFLTVPAQLRSRCSFDTDFSGMRLRHNPTWAIGYRSEVEEKNCYVVDGEASEFVSVDVTFPQSCYTTWVEADLKANGVQAFIDDYKGELAAGGWYLSRIISGEAKERPGVAIGPRLLTDFWRLNRERLEKRVFEQLSRQYGMELGERAATEIIRTLPPRLLFPRLVEGFLANDLIRALRVVYGDSSHIPTRAELDDLSCILDEHDDGLLRTWRACWLQDTETILRELPHLEQDEYRQLLRFVLRTGVLRPAALLCRDHFECFVAEVQQTGFRDEKSLVEIFEVLLRGDEDELVNIFLPLLQGQSKDCLAAVDKVLRRLGNTVPETFGKSVAEKGCGKLNILSRIASALLLPAEWRD